MTLTCILVDLENVQLRVADLAGLSREQHQLKIFHGPSQNKLTIDLVRALQPLGDAVEYIQCEKAGPNALDFHLAFHLGRLTVLQPDVQVLIVSRDKGFAQLVSHANRLGHRVSQHAALQAGVFGSSKAPTPTAEPAPAAAPARKAAARKSVARKTAAAKPAAVAQAPEVKPVPERAPARKAAARKTATAKTPKTPARKSAPAPAPAPEAAPAPAPAPAPQPAAKTAARKSPARKSTRAASAPAATPAAAPQPAAAKSLREVAGAADRAKAVASLNKMGAKRPVRLKALLHHLQSHLRTDLSPDAIESLVQSLMASGVIAMTDGKLTYHLAD